MRRHLEAFGRYSQLGPPGAKSDCDTFGRTALGDEELKQLIVGKTILVRNTVTERRFEILHGADGRRLITAVDGNVPAPHVMGELSHGRQMQYEIRDGQYRVEVAAHRSK